jgi:hypothetical protein
MLRLRLAASRPVETAANDGREDCRSRFQRNQRRPVISIPKFCRSPVPGTSDISILPLLFDGGSPLQEGSAATFGHFLSRRVTRLPHVDFRNCKLRLVQLSQRRSSLQGKRVCGRVSRSADEQSVGIFRLKARVNRRHEKDYSCRTSLSCVPSEIFLSLQPRPSPVAEPPSQRRRLPYKRNLDTFSAPLPEPPVTASMEEC